MTLPMKKFTKEHGLWMIGALVGLLAGYLYYRFIGCSSGSCPITSNPLHSSLYGAVMGALFFSMFKKQKSSTT